LNFVMAGLDPAIHVLAASKKGVDARVKPGHDGKERSPVGFIWTTNGRTGACRKIVLGLKQYPDAS
jgi:hypothetical protein